jgi:hypothetical protein
MMAIRVVAIPTEIANDVRTSGKAPRELQKYPTTFNAYAKGRRLSAQEYVADGNVSEAIERLFRRGDVDYIHARNTEAGCYGFRIERA